MIKQYKDWTLIIANDYEKPKVHLAIKSGIIWYDNDLHKLYDRIDAVSIDLNVSSENGKAGDKT